MTEEEKSGINMLNMTNGLVYGNSENGAMLIIFVNDYGIFAPNAAKGF